jgi:hypothetical protein
MGLGQNRRQLARPNSEMQPILWPDDHTVLTDCTMTNRTIRFVDGLTEPEALIEYLKLSRMIAS